MNEIRDKVKSRMGYLMLEEVSMPIGMPEKITEKLLSIPEIAIIDREAELPKYIGDAIAGTLKDWVKEIKE